MFEQHRKANYDKYPEVVVQGFDRAAWQGWPDVVQAINHHIAGRGLTKTVLVVDYYHGVDMAELKSQLVAPLYPCWH